MLTFSLRGHKKVKDFVKHIKKGLDSEFKRKKEYLADGMYEEERDFMVFLLDGKVRIPYALSFDWDEIDEAPEALANLVEALASGSLGIYGRAQGYDGGTLQGTTETFSGEDFRIQLLDNVTAFSGTAWTTTYALDLLGNYDLQAKPGYLVDPGGDYRYWHPASYGSGTYKYYIRRFQTGGSTYSSMTVNLNNNTLIAWNATTNGVSCALLFESAASGSGNNSELSVCRIYDPTKLTSNLIEADMAADNFKNPFTTAISLYGNDGGSKSSTEYTIPISNAVGQYLDSNDNELYVIIRYKGDPSPVTSITLSYS